MASSRVRPSPPTLAKPGFARSVEDVSGYLSTLHRSATQVLYSFGSTINAILDGEAGPLALSSYTVATLPTTDVKAGSLAYCSNASGGAVPVFWDGTNWRRVTDRVVVS